MGWAPFIAADAIRAYAYSAEIPIDIQREAATVLIRGRTFPPYYPSLIVGHQ